MQPPPRNPSARDLTRLKWLTTLVPAVAAYVYESVRHGLLDRFIPTPYGNLFAGLLVLCVSFAFSQVVFGHIERLQRSALAQEREAAGLRGRVAERERLGRELHDGLAQILASLLVDLDAIQHLLQSGREADAVGEVERMRAQTASLYDDVRDVVSDLRTPVAEHGIGAALEEQALAFEERHGITVHLQTDDLEPLPTSVAWQLFRIVQQALANIRQHSGASNVWITLTSTGEELELTVADDGRGFDPAAPPEPGSIGLASMRERTRELGGSFRVEPRQGGGTCVRVVLPAVRAHARH